MKKYSFITSLVFAFVFLFSGCSNTNVSSSIPSKSTLTNSHISVSNSDLNGFPGEKVSISIKTKPGTRGTIDVIYSYGHSKVAGLIPKTADSRGIITWSWKIGLRTSPGTYRVIITANGSTITRVLCVY